MRAGAGKEQNDTPDRRSVRLFERGIDALAMRPLRYAIGFFLVLASVFSTYSGNISVFGYAIEREYWILSYFIWSLLWQVDSRGAIVLAIGILTTCPFLIVMEQPALAEQAAVSVFYFLAISVVEQVVEYIREERTERVVARRRLKKREVAAIEDTAAPGAHRNAAPAKKTGLIVLGLCLAGVTVLVLGAAYIWWTRQAGTTMPIKKAATFSSKLAEQKRIIEPGSQQSTQSPTVTVVNANGIDNEATRIAELMTAAGYTISSPGTSDTSEQTTRIYYGAGWNQQAKAIATLIESDYPAELVEGGYQDYAGDIVVVLGLDKKQ